jgi:hypothetical protein
MTTLYVREGTEFRDCPIAIPGRELARPAHGPQDRFRLWTDRPRTGGTCWLEGQNRSVELCRQSVVGAAPQRGNGTASGPIVARALPYRHC